MPPKRGRPSLDTDDAALRQRRAQDAERRRRFYARRRAERAERAAQAAAIQPTPAQLQQGEFIMDLPFDNWGATQTLDALQLRVQNMTLAQDAGDARLQQDAIPVNEHDGLYTNTNLSPIPEQPTPNHPIPTTRRPYISQSFRPQSSSSRPSSSTPFNPPAGPSSSTPFNPPAGPSRSNQSSIARFFRSLPPRNPFAPDATGHTNTRPIQPPSPTDDNLGNFQDDVAEPPTDHSSPSSVDNREDQNNGNKGEDDNQDVRGSTISANNRSGTSEPALQDDTNIGGSTVSGNNKAGTPGSAGQDDINVQGSTISANNRTETPESVRDDTSVESVESVETPAPTSERSLYEDEEDEEVEVSALDYTVEKLYAQFQMGHMGCPPEQHQEQLDQHRDTVGNDHHGLNDIFNDPNFPSVLALPDMISVDRLSRQTAPTPAQWQAMYCGVSPEPQNADQRPMHVCLHKEETRPIETDVTFDIDSFLGFFRSLAAARQGILYQPAPLMRQNVTTDVHIQTKVYDQTDDPEEAPRSSLAMLKNVPHFLLGRLWGATEISVHVLFPHLSVVQEKFVSLTKDQISRWLDHIFHPAVYRFCRAHYTQHLPSSYRHALANSKAHQVEGRQIETASYQAQQSIVYHLQPEYLDQIWDDILNTINHTPGFGDFREPQLYFSAKGTKLAFKTSPLRPTLLEAMEKFHSYLNSQIDLDLVFLDRLYIDIGKEICPYLGTVFTQRPPPGDVPQVYLWKRCCLEHYIHEMYDGEPPAKGGQGQRYYDQNMLYDAASLTSVTPKKSKLREGGLIYSQFYASVKEISDAMKRIPFDNDGLEELALDPQIRQGARNLARGHRRDVKIIERGYCKSKGRAQDALRDSESKSFGIRSEHRTAWALFLALLARLRQADPEDWDIVLDECPSYAWAVNTDVYLNFLWRSADKFATGFEVVRAHCHRELITWEQTKIMAMFLRCLRFVFGGHQLQQESALWWSRRELPTRIWYGLGFCNTMPRYGYCWLEPRFDWERLTFHEEITERVLFGNAMLRGQYLRHGGQIRDFFNTTRQLEVALTWLDRHHQNPRIRDQLIFWLTQICLQQFRIDVVNTVRSEISANHQEEALKGDKPFSFEYLDEIMTDDLYLVSGNRSDFKRVSDLVHFLFDYGDGRVRSHWDDRPFRKLYQRARTALDLRHGELQLGATFSRRLWRHLVADHWILPYPSSSGLMQTTKEGKRMWYSIYPKDDAMGPLALLPLKEWVWGMKAWQPGSPPGIHPIISRTKEEWEGWIERHQNDPDR